MKVAVVTGASRGLGRQTAIALAGAGYKVAVNYFHSPKDAEEVVRSAGFHAMAVKADVGSMTDVREMAQRVDREWGRVDVLINNAGVAMDGLMMSYNEDDWEEVMRVNLRGCFNTVTSFVPLMIRSGGGHITNISSYSGLRGKEGQAAYSASKASIIGLTVTLAKELAQHNIRVNSVLPGYMPTAMGMHADRAMKKAREESVLHRLADIEEVAGFVSYLVETETVTGQVFRLDSRI
jgi:3-oxoacyl-[acyl-carrier protein] reductase